MRRGLITGLAVLTIAGTSLEVLATIPASALALAPAPVAVSALASAPSGSSVVREPRPPQGFEFVARPLRPRPKPRRKAKSGKAWKARAGWGDQLIRSLHAAGSHKPRKGKKRRSGKGGEKRKVGNVTVLRVPRGLERKLGDLYYRHVRNEPDVHRGDVVGPINIHYGKVVRKDKPRVVFYAIGDTGIFGDLINPKTLPHVWRKVGANGKWQYVGPTPKGLCGPNLVPRKLAIAWRVGCK